MDTFGLDDDTSWLRWQERKLHDAIIDTDGLIVEIRQPASVSDAEREALLSRIRRSNMAIYATSVAMNEQALRQFGQQLGLNRLDANWLASEDSGISRISVTQQAGEKQAYIPYTDRPIKWHTDGYYNPPERQIRAMLLHCVASAGSGGENRLMDHEMAYLELRRTDPELIRALMAPDVMTIPERTDEHGIARAAQTGPVFSAIAGKLHMRYTARTRSIAWKQDEATLQAVAALEKLLASNSPYIHRVRLEAGQGLLCNNVLHDRAAFCDDPQHPRLLFRARYLDSL